MALPHRPRRAYDKNLTAGHSQVRFLHVFPSYHHGGAELRVTNTINAMGPGVGHAILSINGQTDAKSRLDEKCGVQVFHAPPKRSPLRFPRDLWSMIREISPEVLLTYNWGATDAIIGARIAGFCPVIHNECGLSNEIDGKVWRRHMARRLLLSKCYRTVVTAQSLYEIVRDKFRVPANKIAYIKTGVDTTRFKPTVNTALRAEMQSHEGVVIGYVGSLRPSKNVPRILRAFAATRRPVDRLAIFGSGPEEHSLRQLGNDLGLGESIRFFGHFDDVTKAYSAIDVYATASRSEAASNSLLEAMASGLPALSTDIADNKVLLAPENRTFVFDDADETGFVDGMRLLLRDANVRKNLGNRNRQQAIAEYPLERMFREYAELWNTAATLSNAPKRKLASQIDS